MKVKGGFIEKVMFQISFNRINRMGWRVDDTYLFQ